MSSSELAIENYCSSVELLKICSTNNVKSIKLTLDVQTCADEKKQITFSYYKNSVSDLAVKLESVHLDMLHRLRCKAIKQLNAGKVKSM